MFDATERRRYERELLAARDRERAARERVERLQRISATLGAPRRTPPRSRAAACAALAEAVGAQRAGLQLEGRALATLGDPGAPAGAARAAFARRRRPRRRRAVGRPAGRSSRPEERAVAAAMRGADALALERARLYEEQRDVAHTLQQALLSGAPPEDPRFARRRALPARGRASWRSAATGTTRSRSRATGSRS